MRRSPSWSSADFYLVKGWTPEDASTYTIERLSGIADSFLRERLLVQVLVGDGIALK